MALTEIYKGSDEVIVITVTDGTDPIDLATADDITVSVYQRSDVIIQQWKLSDSEVTITDASNGICQVNLDRDNTADLESKRLYIEVALQLVNADFESGVMIEKDSNVPLCDLANSPT